ncbi:barnase inhibitor [Intrasporangium oryzae NRRL B-24470]|uniref:Barnase inhibitor n=1 Tax=Intrasporangium oryzae NRRL B-24470 TaxID=1386089 RepID=W9G865_9MICO|nr:barstar family protein [Intrasporangium oryzae]EWT01467.1 barnase inhibitor [Intrasporangium oryzae NRRL B-24470]
MTTFLGRHSEAEDHLADLDAQGLDVRVVTAGTDKESVLDGFATGLELPTWFGRNWDALLDALRDLDAARGRTGIALVWDHTLALRDGDRATYRTVLDVLEQVEDEREDLWVTVINR